MIASAKMIPTMANGTLAKVSIVTEDKFKNETYMKQFSPLNMTANIQGSDKVSDKINRYLQAINGAEYSIRVDIKDSKKYLVGIAIDGRNIVSGEKIYNPSQASSWKSDSWIVNGTDNDFRGWIKQTKDGSQKIKRFKFSSGASVSEQFFNDYSARGTITIAIFREAPQVITRGGTRGGGTSKGLGTSFGKTEDTSYGSGEFNPKGVAYEIFTFRYATKSDLKKAGIWRPKEKPVIKNNRLFNDSTGINFGD